MKAYKKLTIREECGPVNQQHIITNRGHITGQIWSHCDKVRATVCLKPVTHLYAHCDDTVKGVTDMPTALRK